MDISYFNARGATSLRRSKWTLIALASVSAVAIVMLLSRSEPTAIPTPAVLRCSSSSNIIDWTRLDFETLTGRQILDYIQWTNAGSCRLSQYFGGNVGGVLVFGIDGQKAVCMDPEIRPFPGRCLVYSFGINDEWSFEDSMDRYGCEIYAFDPSMNMSDHDRNGGKIHFFNLGLGDRDEVIEDNWHVRPLSAIYGQLAQQRHGPGRIIDYLKIDIEEDEWSSLVDILQSGMLAKVRQLAIEVHLPREGDIKAYRRLVSLIKSMEEEHDMVRFDSKINPYSEGSIEALIMHGYRAHEMAWYNNRLKRRQRYYNM